MITWEIEDWERVKKYVEGYVRRTWPLWHEDIMQELYLCFVRHGKSYARNPRYEQTQILFEKNVTLWLKKDACRLYKILTGKDKEEKWNVSSNLLDTDGMEWLENNSFVEEEENIELIMEDFKDLKEDVQAVIKYTLQGYSCLDIAPFFDITESGIHTKLTRLRNHPLIRKYFNKYKKIDDYPRYMIHNIKSGMKWLEARRAYHIQRWEYEWIKEMISNEYE